MDEQLMTDKTDTGAGEQKIVRGMSAYERGSSWSLLKTSETAHGVRWYGRGGSPVRRMDYLGERLGQVANADPTGSVGFWSSTALLAIWSTAAFMSKRGQAG
jgi:hypothetical protein